jgi:hypothetical protein
LPVVAHHALVGSSPYHFRIGNHRIL